MIVAELVSLQLSFRVQFSSNQIILQVNKQRNMPSMTKMYIFLSLILSLSLLSIYVLN